MVQSKFKSDEEEEQEQSKSKKSEKETPQPKSPIKKIFNKKKRKTKSKESTRKIRLSRANLKGLERMLTRVIDSEIEEYHQTNDNTKVINLLTIAFKHNVLSDSEVEQIKNQRLFEYPNTEEKVEKTYKPLIEKLLEDKTKLTLIDVNEALSKLLQEEAKSKRKYKRSKEINHSLSIIDKLLNNIEIKSNKLAQEKVPAAQQVKIQQPKVVEDDDDEEDNEEDEEEEEEDENG